jgi:hypothetical protein
VLVCKPRHGDGDKKRNYDDCVDWVEFHVLRPPFGGFYHGPAVGYFRES